VTFKGFFYKLPNVLPGKINSSAEIKVSKAILITGHGDPDFYEISRLPHFLYN
jgi:hypothetical protein